MNGLRVYSGEGNDGPEFGSISNIRVDGTKKARLPGCNAPEVLMDRYDKPWKYHPQAIIRNGKWHATNLCPTSSAYGLSIDFEKADYEIWHGQIKGYEWVDSLQPGDVVVPLREGADSERVFLNRPSDHEIKYSRDRIEQSLNRAIESRTSV